MTAYGLRISDWSSGVFSSDLVRQRRVIGKIVIGQRMNQRAQPRRLDRRDHRRNRCTQKMHLILRDRMRPRSALGHVADQQDRRIAAETVAQRGGGIALGVVEIDMGMIGGIGVNHKLSWSTPPLQRRSEEHTSELQSLMRISYAVFCLKKKTTLHT